MQNLDKSRLKEKEIEEYIVVVHIVVHIVHIVHIVSIAAEMQNLDKYRLNKGKEIEERPSCIYPYH